MMNNVINLAERRIARAQARKTMGHCAAMAHELASAVEHDYAPMTAAALTRWYMVQEAIDEFLASGEKFHIGDVVARVNEWEKMLNNGKA